MSQGFGGHSDGPTPPEHLIAEIQALIARELPHPAEDGPTVQGLQRLCRAAARVLPASGAGVSLMNGDGDSHGVAAASDPTSEVLEELQFTLGEGPCLEAFASRVPVLVPDLAAAPSEEPDRDGSGPAAPAPNGAPRWPVYASAAQQQGVRAVFAFPLQVGTAGLGVLDVYRARPGRLSARALGQALTFAEIAVMTLLDGQAATAGEGAAAGLDDALGYRAELYQAQGMLQIQLGVDLEEAMLRLRAYAYAHDRRLADVARAVVGRKLRLERDDDRRQR